MRMGKPYAYGTIIMCTGSQYTYVWVPIRVWQPIRVQVVYFDPYMYSTEHIYINNLAITQTTR